MSALFAWLDQHPAVYGVIGLGAMLPLAVWLAVAWRRGRDGRGAGVRVSVCFLIAIAGWRWPALLEVRDVGAEEAKWVATAVSSRDENGITFRAVDLLDGGPLPVLALLPTHGAGVPQDYFNARLVALLLDWGALVLGFLVLRRWVRAASAALGLMPALLLLAGMADERIAVYSAWHLVLFLGAMAGWLWTRAVRATGGWLAGGFVAGLAAWCGIETMPAAIVLLGVGTGVAGRAGRKAVGRLWVGAGYAWAAGYCWLHGIGQVDDFWIRLLRPSGVTEGGLGWGAWLGPALALAALASAAAVARVETRPARKTAWALGLTGVGLSIAARLAAGVPAIFGNFGEYWRHPRSPAAEAIAAMAKPGDTMAVWGWRPGLHVETGLRQAARSVASGREIEGREEDAFFRRRYLRDVRERKPVFFVDAVGPGAVGFADREKQGHEVFAELRELVRYEYALVKETPDARIYMSVEQVSARNPQRRGAAPLTVAAMTRAEAGVPLNALSETRLLAHPPSVLEHPVPAGAELLRGAIGIMADAYANPPNATDGATFAVEVIDAEGRRERRFARRLDPVARPEDRGTFEFTVDLRGGDARAVQLVTEAGETPNYDWTYWEGLRFEGAGLP